MIAPTLPRQPDWYRRAACLGLSDIFDDPAQVESAKSICRTCPVRLDCLNYALAERETHGVWGGLSERLRTSILRGRPRKTCPDCGGKAILSMEGAEACRSCGMSWFVRPGMAQVVTLPAESAA